jgi:transposase-like protein
MAPGNIMPVTNAIETLNASVRKAVRNKGHFPSDQAATKLIWLALRNIAERWKNPPISWHAAKAQLAIQFEERFVLSE